MEWRREEGGVEVQEMEEFEVIWETWNKEVEEAAEGSGIGHILT